MHFRKVTDWPQASTHTSNPFPPVKAASCSDSSDAPEQKSVRELFGDFYAERSGGSAPDEEDLALLSFAEEIAMHADTHAAPTAEEIDRLLSYLAKQEAKA